MLRATFDYFVVRGVWDLYFGSGMSLLTLWHIGLSESGAGLTIGSGRGLPLCRLRWPWRGWVEWLPAGYPTAAIGVRRRGLGTLYILSI